MFTEKLRKFHFWCHKVLPLVYDNSLSYYEVLCKLRENVNELIDVVRLIGEELDRMNERLDIMEAKFAEMEAKFEEMLAEFERMRESIAQMLAKIEEFERRILSVENEITNILETLSKHESDISSLRSDVDANSKEIVSINERIENLNSALSDAFISISNLEANINNLETRFRTLVERVNTLESRVSDMLLRFTPVSEILDIDNVRLEIEHEDGNIVSFPCSVTNNGDYTALETLTFYDNKYVKVCLFNADIIVSSDGEPIHVPETSVAKLIIPIDYSSYEFLEDRYGNMNGKVNVSLKSANQSYENITINNYNILNYSLMMFNAGNLTIYDDRLEYVIGKRGNTIGGVYGCSLRFNITDLIAIKTAL